MEHLSRFLNEKLWVSQEDEGTKVPHDVGGGETQKGDNLWLKYQGHEKEWTKVK